MRNLTIFEAAKHLRPRPEEPTEGRRLEGRPQARPYQRPSFETPCCARLLRIRPEVLRTLVASLPLLLALGSGTAYAHAFLDHADPRVGNTVKGPPRTVALWFTQNLESAFSSIEVLDANGARMNAGNASVDANNRKRLRVPFKVLPSPTYAGKEHVLSVDTHTP